MGPFCTLRCPSISYLEPLDEAWLVVLLHIFRYVLKKFVLLARLIGLAHLPTRRSVFSYYSSLSKNENSYIKVIISIHISLMD